ncbi:MAG: tetratricopeptide repeat protein [Armatimonadetes bacterium]|nr:tetratricopeptide repeat protein [Armatimonadota bacterium]
MAAPTAADRAGNDPARRVVISPAVGAGPAGRAVGTGPARRAMISAGAGSSRSNLWPWVVAAFLAVAVGVGGYLVRARAPEVEPPRAATADFVPQDFLENGRKAYEAGDYQKAIPQLEVALDVLAGPDQLKARKLLASALFKQGVYDKAEIHYKLLAAQDPSYKTWLAESRARGRTAARTRGQRALDNAEHALASGDRRSALSLGEEALAIFEDHGGSSQQMASARDVIERSRQSADRSADRPLAGQPLPEPGRPATTAPGTRAYPVARKAVPATPEPMLAPSDPSLAAPEPFAEPGVPGQEPQGTGAPPNRPASQAQARSQPDPLYTPSALQAKDGGRPPGY